MSSSLHQHTPTLKAVDPRGLVVRNVAYWRTSPHVPAKARISCQVWCPIGFLLEQWDPRLYALRQSEPLIRPNQRNVYSLGAQLLHTHSVDAGGRWLLRGTAGQVLRRWDSRGAAQRYEFDPMLRPVCAFEQADDETKERCVERLSYAGNTEQDRAANRCTRLIRHDDPAGTLHYERYAITGQVLSEQRLFRQSLERAHWPQPMAERDQLQQPQRYTTTWQYDAFGAVVEQTDARNNRQHTRYDIDGLLLESALTLSGGERQILVDQRVYNANEQLLSERSGNDVITVASYSPLDNRLQRLTAHRVGQQATPLQDLMYQYDRVGNVIQLSDNAQPVQWACNAQINPASTYVYDSLYQLISATGRENAKHTARPDLSELVLFGATDDSLCRPYSQTYAYDEAGNLTRLQHQVNTGQGYSRTLAVSKTSNHGVLQDNDAPAGATSTPDNNFDANGNQRALARGQAMQWTVANQLSAVTLVKRENGTHDNEAYAYDSVGQRVRKVRTTQASARQHTLEVLYLPGLEIRHDTAKSERLNIITAQAGRGDVRVLQWDEGRVPDMPDKHMRFSLSDHLGSSTLELNGRAELLSQESYYPYGATAWRAAKNILQARYKTHRYSGKEQDASGLYYYGFRYYAPGLQRWISADPAGDIDGLNLYRMVSNNPVTLRDALGLNGLDADTRPARVQALDSYLREHHPAFYPAALNFFDHQYSLRNAPKNSLIDAVRAAGYSYAEMGLYNKSVEIEAFLPGNIFQGLASAYIASASYFNEAARAMTNPAVNPDAGAWTGADVWTTFQKMEPTESRSRSTELERSGIGAALRVGRQQAVQLFDMSIRHYPSGQATTYRGHRVSDTGLSALKAHASMGDVVRTEQFLSVSGLRSVAKSFAMGSYDARQADLHPVMLTVIGSSAMELASPVNEAERVYPLETAFKVEHAGFSSAVIKAYAPSATHFVLRETSVTAQRRKMLPFMTDPGGRRAHR